MTGGRWKARWYERRGDDRGVALIFIAFCMVALLLVAAIIIDLGYQRNSVTSDQSIADLAALAAGDDLGDGNYGLACQDAINYLNTNTPSMPAITASTYCNTLGITCPNTEKQLSQTSGNYKVQIHFPVPDSEIADPTYGAGTHDGTPCTRMRVIVTSTDPAWFGGVAGKSSYSGTKSATVMADTAPPDKIPALWLLDPTGCVALGVTGGSKVTVGVENTADPTQTSPGFVTIDSDGTSCTGQTTTVSVTGSMTQLHAVPTTADSLGNLGAFNLYAMPIGASACSDATHHDCATADVTNARLLPQPGHAKKRATRAPVDHKWNCKTTYPNYRTVVTIASCMQATTTPPYIDQLKAAVGTSGQPSVGTWTKVNGSACNASTITYPAGNYWVACNTFSVGTGTTVDFAGGNVIFDGGIKMTGSGVLKFNDNNPTASLPSTCVPPNITSANPVCIGNSSAKAAFVFVRNNGAINITGGTLMATKTAFYTSGDLKVNGSPPTWTNPSEGPFKGLALWDEGTSSNSYQMAGGAGPTLKGTFFMPEANFAFSGGGTWSQPESAQFIAADLSISGGATFTMAPDKNEQVPVDVTLPRLIR